MDKRTITVLLVEDNEGDILLARRMLANYSQLVECVVESVQSLSEAVKYLSSDKKCDVILLDMGLPDSSGIETVQRVRQANQYIPIVVLTGFDDEETGLLTIKNGATDYLVKDRLSKDILIRTLNFALERKHAEEEVRNTKTMLENITRGISEEIMLLDKDLKILWANHSLLTQTSNKPENISGKYCYQVTHNQEFPCCPPQDPCPVAELRKTGCQVNMEHIHFDKDGNKRFVDVSVYPVKDEKGEIVQFIHLSRDITERRKAEESLRFQKMLLESQNEASMDGILNVDANGKIIWFNRRFVEMWQIPQEEIQSGSDDAVIRYILDEIVDPDTFVVKIRELYTNRDVRSKDEICLKDGRVFERYSSPVIGEGKYLGRIWVFHDFTNRKRAEESLRRERNKAQNYLDVAGVIMLVLNDDLTVHRINNKGCEILGFTEKEIFEKNWCDNFVPPECRKEVSEMLKGLINGEIGKYEYHENPVLTQTGRQRLIAWHNSVLRDEIGRIKSILSSGEDITERKEAEDVIKKAYNDLEKANANLKNMQAQIIQNEKLASIGQLAAGIAHEMNTPVGFTASNFETLATYFSKFKTLLDMYNKLAGEMPNIDKNKIIARTAEIEKTADDMKMGFILEDINALFEESKEGLQRVTTIIQNLRDFSRVDKIDSYDEFDIRRGMEATLAVARNTIKYNANVTIESADIPHAICNASQINQVFLNILVNAAQAIESQQKGRMGNIKIRIYPSDPHVVCEIEDDGPGIPQEYLKRVFEPFFTTKPAGKGTGLGLAVSYDIIVNKHKGVILIDSQVGRGAKFTIKLPISRKTPDSGKEIESNGQENHIICGR